MSEQYSIDSKQPDVARAAFDFLEHEHRDELGDIFTGIDYFDPLPPLKDDELVHYVFPIQHEPHDTGLAMERIMIADMKGSRPVGFGQAAAFRNREGHLISDPEVVHTETIEGERQQGYGRRRLIALNKYSGEYFGRPLQSNVNMGPEAKLTWQSLVRDGLAEELSGRFRFREAPTT